MSDDTEIELKLAVAKGRIDRVRRTLGAVAVGRKTLRDVYFDTPDGALRRHGLVLRVRRDGNRWLQTMKSAPAEAGVVPVRGEWEARLPASRVLPRPDLRRIRAAPLAALMRTGLDASGLAPLFGTRIVRRHAVVPHSGSRIEVAIDRGVLKAFASGQPRRRRVAELELELASGSAEHLLELATAIADRARGVTLVPALRTKAERGYALAQSGRLPVARAHARGFSGQLGAAMGPGEALRAALRHGLAIVVANADALREAPEVEHVHQARVALRRMRSAIRLLDEDGSDFPRRLLEPLRRLARTLGEARDWDVLVDGTLPALIGDAGSASRSGRKLHRAARRARRGALDCAVGAVANRRYARLVLAIARWTMSAAPPAAITIGESAPRLLDRAADRLFAQARGFVDLGRKRQHRVRILAKRLRYALDLLAPTLARPRQAADYVEALAELQDSLGELNDAAVARERLGQLAPSRAQARTLARRIATTEDAMAARAGRQLDALTRRPRPWRPA